MNLLINAHVIKIGFKTIKNSVISVNDSAVSSESVGNKTFLHVCAH
jgi:hypothetical protein